MDEGSGPSPHNSTVPRRICEPVPPGRSVSCARGSSGAIDRHGPAGMPAGRPGRLEVVPAGDAVDVEDLAREVEARADRLSMVAMSTSPRRTPPQVTNSSLFSALARHGELGVPTPGPPARARARSRARPGRPGRHPAPRRPAAPRAGTGSPKGFEDGHQPARVLRALGLEALPRLLRRARLGPVDAHGEGVVAPRGARGRPRRTACRIAGPLRPQWVTRTGPASRSRVPVTETAAGAATPSRPLILRVVHVEREERGHGRGDRVAERGRDLGRPRRSARLRWR